MNATYPEIVKRINLMAAMNYTSTKVGGFWEHKVVFRILHLYSEYLTYGTLLSYHG